MRPELGATIGHDETGEECLDWAVAGSVEVEDMVAGGSLFWLNEEHGVSSKDVAYGTSFETERGPTVEESGAVEHPVASMSGGFCGESGPLLV